MPTRLAAVAPDIEETIASVAMPTRVRAAMAVAKSVLGLVPGSSSELVAAEPLSPSKVAAIVDRLDERYFTLSEQGSTEAEAVFSQARAAAAVRFALEGAPEEALYEAVIAIDNSSKVHELLRVALNAPV